MKALLTEAEVAEVMQVTPRWVREQGLPSTAAEVVSRNGRPARMYPVSGLPPDAQRIWAERQKVVEIVPAQPVPGQLALALTAPMGPNLSPEDRAEAERRFTVIEPLVSPDRYYLLWSQARNRKGAVIEQLVKQHQTPARTIYHWLALFKKGGLPALVNRDRSDKGQPRRLNRAALDYILAASLPKRGQYGLLSVRDIYRGYKEERTWRAAHATKPLGDFEIAKYGRYVDEDGKLSATAQLPEASYETLRVWCDRIPELVKVLAREGEEAWHNTQEILTFRNLTEIKPLDYLVMDHRRLDIFCMAPAVGGWKLIRPWLTAAIDMRCRKWMAWVIVETPSSDSIACVLKRTFIDHGLPAACYWDNGKDFTCEWLEGKQTKSRQVGAVKELDTGMRGVMETLGVRVHHAIVRRARSKIIEPNFLHTALWDKASPWWCGNRPQTRPEGFAKLVDEHERWLAGARPDPVFPTLEQVARMYDDLLRELNEREHTGEGMSKITATGKGWMCPNEAWEKFIGGVERRSVPADTLQFCFVKRRVLTVRNGEVRTVFGGRPYHYRLADSSVRLMSYNGRDVELAFDPLDLGTAAVYCDGNFVGLANSAELRRMGEDAFVQDEKDRRAARREVKRFIQAVHHQVPMPSWQERVNRRAAVDPRVEPVRVEVPAELPAPVVEAARAAKEQDSFSFAAAGADLIHEADASAYRDDDPDDEFRFFGGTNDESTIGR